MSNSNITKDELIKFLGFDSPEIITYSIPSDIESAWIKENKRFFFYSILKQADKRFREMGRLIQKQELRDIERRIEIASEGDKRKYLYQLYDKQLAHIKNDFLLGWYRIEGWKVFINGLHFVPDRDLIAYYKCSGLDLRFNQPILKTEWQRAAKEIVLLDEISNLFENPKKKNAGKADSGDRKWSGPSLSVIAAFFASIYIRVQSGIHGQKLLNEYFPDIGTATKNTGSKMFDHYKGIKDSDTRTILRSHPKWNWNSILGYLEDESFLDRFEPVLNNRIQAFKSQIVTR